jgi:predicted porin
MGMTGGFKVSAGRLSLLAATGFLLVGGVHAQAADLGGNCCADLEERIAELEATTARKGNRKVSLTIYGQVNEAIGYWDDGSETNTYLFTNDTSRTRIGFKGKAKISGDWFAEYKIEIGIRSEDQGELSADADDGGTGTQDVRHASWTLGSKTYGSVTMGETSMSHDGITQSQTARIGHFSNPDIFDANDGFALRTPGGGRVSSWEGITQVFEPGEGSRGSLVRYDTPEFAGFMASAHWGEDDIWGMAIKYEGEIGPFEVTGGIGYGVMRERDEECTAADGFQSDCEEYGMSLSAMHKPSGLFLTGAYGVRLDDGRAAILASRGFAADDELSFWHLQGGIEQKWFPVGETTLFVGYQDRDSGHVINDNGGANIGCGGGCVITDSQIEMYEIGLNQHLSSAAMDLYLHYKHYDADLTADTGGVASSLNTEPWQTVIGGAMIKF